MYELQPVGVLPSISSSLSFVLLMRYPNITVLWDRNDPGRRLVNPTPIHIYIIYPKFILIHANKKRYAPLYSSALTNGCAYLIKGPRPSKFSAAFANPIIPSVSNSQQDTSLAQLTCSINLLYFQRDIIIIIIKEYMVLYECMCVVTQPKSLLV